MSRPQQRSLRAWALGFSLVVAVGSIGVLVYQAVGLDRSHRAVAEGVLRDYSAFAADQFSRLAAERITALSKTILAPVACGASPQIRRAAAAARASSCANPTAVDGFFEADLATGGIVFATGAVESSIREAFERLATEGPFGFGLVSGDGPPRVVGYWSDAVPGATKAVVGFIAPAAILQPVFDEIVRNERLLPGLLIEPAQNRDYLTIDVRDAHGTSVYRSGDEHGRVCGRSTGWIASRERAGPARDKRRSRWSPDHRRRAAIEAAAASFAARRGCRFARYRNLAGSTRTSDRADAG